jgi:hypothetical protein
MACCWPQPAKDIWSQNLQKNKQNRSLNSHFVDVASMFASVIKKKLKKRETIENSND